MTSPNLDPLIREPLFLYAPPRGFRHTTPSERFLAKVEFQPDGCWYWTASVTNGGYGRFLAGDKTRVAHRVAYEWAKGPVPAGLQLDHLCRVRHCVNPDHLEPVTARENVLRGEGSAAFNARKTHCKRGHELAGDNMFIKQGQRICRRCQLDHHARWARANREHINAKKRERAAARREMAI